MLPSHQGLWSIAHRNLNEKLLHWCDVHEKSNLYKLFPHTEGLNRADLYCLVLSIFSFFSRYWCWCCHWHHLVLCFCLLNLFIFHRAARYLLEDFVGIYLAGNSSFLQETVDKNCLQFEVNIWFMLSICKHEICSFIMWTAICLGYIFFKFFIYYFQPTSPWEQTQLVSLLTATLCSARREVG